MTILLSHVLPIAEPGNYKCHFARWNGKNQPLEVFIRDRQEWRGWQEYRGDRNDFNREYIFSLMSFYHEPDCWLYGGTYRVLERHPDRYVVELAGHGQQFIGRLKLHLVYRERQTRTRFENHYSKLEVREITPEPFSGRGFEGFESVDLSFEELETLVRNDRQDWKAPLANVKGIYVITDTSTGRRYVGKASGEKGIWARWSTYVSTGHGGNKELKELVDDPNLAYCRANFRFALLEYRPSVTPDDVIDKRETFWKNLLLTRGEYGLNAN